MAGLTDVAKEAGLDPIVCEHCGNRIRTSNVLRRLFEGILKRVKAGEHIQVMGFGTFYTRVLKGRKLKSNMVGDGNKEFGDMLILKFSQSPKARSKLNGEK